MQIDDTILIQELSRSLNDREAEIITLKYFEGYLLRNIAADHGLSESRISQIHKKAILKMRLKLNGKN